MLCEAGRVDPALLPSWTAPIGVKRLAIYSPTECDPWPLLYQ